MRARHKGNRDGEVKPRLFRGTVLNHRGFDLIEAHFVAAALVELHRASAGVACHRRGLLQPATVLEAGRL